MSGKRTQEHGEQLQIKSRAAGASWRAIGRELGLSGETVKKIAPLSLRRLPLCFYRQ
jgi:DNA mismatch repair protein MutH